MAKWLRKNIKLVSTIGLIILILLVWFLGPFVGLETQTSRLICIIAIFSMWVLALLIGAMLAARAAALVESFLRKQTDDAVINASNNQRADIARMRTQMLSAINTLKGSKTGKLRGNAALYELPWYMIIGHTAAGKSSAIHHSGLTFPIGDKQSVPGVGGTRDCDWFFSTEGILLDTAGRYASRVEDKTEWQEFLELLKKNRPKAPINGIILAISFPELAKFRMEGFDTYATQVRNQIGELDQIFGVKIPVYIFFTKVDLLGGFAHFFEDMSEEQRQQVWGATLSHDQGSTFDAVKVVEQQFDTLHRGLVQIGNERLVHTRNATCPALFAFPIEFNAMREPIIKLIGLLFRDDPYHSKPLLRGFYFTSALQEGAPNVMAASRVASQFDLAKPGFDTLPLPMSNGFFLRDLFREVLFADQHLVTRQLKPNRTRLRVAGVAAGLCALTLVIGFLTWSYVANEKLIATANDELGAVRKLSSSAELVDRLTALQILQLRLEQLYRYRQNGHPVSIGMGLYQGDLLEHKLRAEYFAGVKLLMLEPVAVNLEGRLTELHSPTEPIAAPVPAPVSPSHRQSPRPAPRVDGLPVIPLGYLDPSGVYLATSRNTIFHDHEERRVMRANMPYVIKVVSKAQTARLAEGADHELVTAQGDSMEEAYNALKTYLMLNQKQRMEIAHLSDQIPKYWRPWLESHKGKSSFDEISRLAERVVAFYVSQVNEPDLPLIGNRADVVASSREILSIAVHRLPAKERIYNELKARANVQFAPITVGRILNNSNLNVVIGGDVVPGAFTRDAWEKYFNNAIGEVSKGEFSGDDWVLATKTKDDLRDDGDVSHNRAELEALYKADYVHEWKKFLQNIAVQDFGTLDNSVQVLGKLADPQNSAIRLILASAAYETTWDNRTRVSQSIDTAKDAIVKRTQALIQEQSPLPAFNDVELGELGSKFALLQALTNPGEGGRTQLSAYFEQLARLKARIAQIAASPETGDAALKLMQATLNGSASELADELTLVDSILLANASEETKEMIRPLLVRPLIQTYAALVPRVDLEINHAWQTDVFPAWRALSGKYPFSDAGGDAPLADIARFLKPREGALPNFIDKTLSGLVVRRADVLTPRTWANLGVNFNPAFLSGVARLATVGSELLQDSDGSRFELQPIPTPGFSETLIEIDGQTLRYRNGPQPWTSFTWPNPANQNAQGARLQAVTFAGVSNSVANYNGRLGLMRLLAQAKIDNPTGAAAQLTWSVKANRTLDGKGAASINVDTDAEVVRFNFRMVNGVDPLTLSRLHRLNLPEKITN